MTSTAGWGTDVLAGEVVVDLSSGIAGAACTKVLADAGATVVKVEDPGGDPLRRRWPTAPVGPPGDGPLFRYLGQSKEGVVVDPAEAVDRAVVRDLVAGADVVVWSPGSAVAGHDDFGPHALRAANPAAVVCAITPFGLDGPWAHRPATDLTIQAWSGGIGHRGEPDGVPVCAGGRISEWATGVFATVSVLTARHRSRRDGGGELLDVAMLDSAASTLALAYPVTFLAVAGRPLRLKRTINVPGVHRAADGWGGFMVLTGQQWLDFCVLVEHPEWIDDEGLLLLDRRAERRAEIVAAIDEWMARHTIAEVLEATAELRVPAAAVGNGQVTAQLAQVQARGMVEAGPDGALQPVPPFRFGGGTTRRAPRPAPVLGVAGAGVRASAGAAGPRPGSGTDAPRGRRAFEGLRVADLTAFWAGPTPGRFLALMGADVIRVESPDKLDGFRYASLRSFDEPRWWEWTPMVEGGNVGKRHLGLDLDSEAGRAVLLRLVARCDVLIENYTPRVMERWGLGHDALLAANPDLLVARMPAFGLEGPWRDRPGYAQTMEMFSGMVWVTGQPDGPPMLPNGQVDPIGGYLALEAILLGLEERRRRGRGLLVECPLLGSAMSIAAEQVVHRSATGELMGRMGNRDPGCVPQGVYGCADDPDDAAVPERWVAVSVPDDATWVALRHALGDPTWAAEPSLATAAGRWADHDRIDREIEAWCRRRRADDVVDALWSVGVPVGRVLLPHEQRQAVQLDARGFFEDLTHPVTGTNPHATFPARFSSVEGPVIPRPAPTLGQHNHEVLCDLLGLSSEEVATLEEAGVVGTLPRGELA